jgi:hypothetical protein
MGTATLELNDAALAVVVDGELVATERGYAAVRDGKVAYGADALRLARLSPRTVNRRFWATLDEQPLAQPLGRCRTAADLVQGQLANLWSMVPPGVDRVAFAVPPGWTVAQLGLLLGIARDVGIPVSALVDSAVAASRRPYQDCALWHLEILLSDAWLTQVVAQGETAAVGSRERVAGFGLETLERASAEFLARRFVECARFDPLHQAVTEQSLYEHLPDWLMRLARQDEIDIELQHQGNVFRATVSAVALRDVILGICEPLIRRLRTLLAPRDPAVLQIPHVIAGFSGFVEGMQRMPNCMVVLLEPVAAARGAMRLTGTVPAGRAVHLITSLPWDQPAVVPGTLPRPPATDLAQIPTHVLFEGKAWRLGDHAVQVGTELPDNHYGIRLDSRSQGVSRRHCTLQIEDGRALVHDQSRYGTLLNGHRIEGSAVLQAGDVLSIGQPPRELRLIVEVARGP